MAGEREPTPPSGSRPEAGGKVSCGVCMKEIPASEAMSSEARDYVVYFCGADCYERWRTQSPSSPHTGQHL